jgi:FkbM family methyltransferase
MSYNFESLQYLNKSEFSSLKKEIFNDEIYFFESDLKNPTIIDAGAYIGLSTLYFKQLYPGSKIYAIEPNPKAFEVLEANILDNSLFNCISINGALSKGEGEREFFIDKGDRNWNSTASFYKGTWQGGMDSIMINVRTFPLSGLLVEDIDLLKMDIEGAEFSVLREAESKLNCVKRLILEYHPVQGNSLKKLLKIVNSNFRNVQQRELGDGLILIEASK